MPRQAAHAAPHRPLGITLGHLVTMRDFPPKDDNGDAIYGHVVTRTARFSGRQRSTRREILYKYLTYG